MQPTIGLKLFLGIGIILGLFLVSGLAIYSEAKQIGRLIAVMSQSDEPAAFAAQEMEINLGETGLTIRDYLHDPKAEVLERLSDAEEDFRKAHALYREAARTPQARSLGERVERAYDHYLTLAGDLIRIRDRQTTLLESYSKLGRSLYGHIEQRLEMLVDRNDASLPAKLEVVTAMQSEAHELDLGLANFLQSGESQRQIRAQEDAREFVEHLERYQSLGFTPEEERWGAELRRIFDEIMTLVAQLTELEKNRQDILANSIEARLGVDDLLDEELQVYIQKSFYKTKQEILDVGNHGVFQVFVLLFVALFISVVVGVVTTRSISRPLRHLLSAIEGAREGDLPRQVAVTSRDEVGHLAQAFNRMTGELQRTTVSRAYVEGIIRGMSESLVVVSGKGVIETVNPAACTLLGYRESELVGLPFGRVLAEWPAIAGRIAAGSIPDLEAEYRTKDGRRLPVLFSANRLRSAGDHAEAVVCVALDITELKRSRHELAESRERLRELARHLNATIEADRARIAREVHDQLGQAMTSLKLDLGWLGRRLERALGGGEPAVGEKIGIMSRLIDDTIRVVRRIAAELRPAALDDFGLGPALEILAEQFSERTGIVCATDLHAQVSLTPEQSTALYRIAQEALINISRHAGASRARMLLRSEKDSAILEIGDDGCGITKEQLAGPRSLGLLGMQERAREQGGTVTIDGRPGEGTTVRAAIPLASGTAAHPGADDPAACSVDFPDPFPLPS